MGDVSRFPRGKQVASYLGLIPREYSSGGHQRFGSISKQGNGYADAAGGSGASSGALRSGISERVFASLPQQAKGVAKVAAARKLAIRLYWMLRTQTAVSGDRSCREQLAGARGRRKLDRRIDWALSSRLRNRGFG